MKAAADKYSLVFKTELKNRIAEKFDFLLHLAYLPLAALIVYFVWSTVFQNTKTVQGFSFNDMIAYAMTALLVRRISQNAWVASTLEKDITEGRIITFLCRPLDYKAYNLAQRLGWNFVLALVVVPLIIIIAFAFSQNITALHFLLGLLMLALAVVFTFLEFYCVGLLAFWFERVWGFKHAADWTQEILSGTWFPITLFPLFVQNALFFLPFQYLVYLPTTLMIGKASVMQGLQGLAILGVWAIAFWLLSNWVWKQGLKKHDGKG